MRTAWLISILTLLATTPVASCQTPDPVPDVSVEEKTLRDANLPVDGPGVLAYLRAQIISEEEHARLRKTIAQLGHRSFAVRERATKTLIEGGHAVAPLLKQPEVLNNTDLEIARRAERIIEQINRTPYASVISSVARILAVRRPEGAAEALLAYMPLADGEDVKEALLAALVACGQNQGKIEAGILSGLKDRESSRRAAAAFVLGRVKPPQMEALRPLLLDANAEVRYRAGESLVRGGEKDAVPVLIALLQTGPARLSHLVEDFLYRLAGEQAPAPVSWAEGPDTRLKHRQNWDRWWQTHQEQINLAKIDFDELQRGLTLYCEYDGNNGGRVWLAGRDGKSRWEISGLQGPNDARLLPNGRVLIAERNSSRVTERDTQGKIHWEKHIDSGAIAAQRLPSGNTLITSWREILEVAPGGGIVWSYTHPSGMRYAYRMRNGRILGVSASGQVVVLSAEGKQLRLISPERHGNGAGYWATVESLPNGRYLVALGSAKKVVEIDDRGAIQWESEVPNAVFATRLPNGRTLVCNFEARQIVELDRSGKELSTQTLQGRPFAVRRY